MSFPVFDLHCDTALSILGRDGKTTGELRRNHFHIDLERAEKLPGYCQCFACYTTPYMEERFHVSPSVIFERELATVQREVEKNKDWMQIVYSAEEIERNLEAGMMSAVLTLEGTAGIEYNPEVLEDLYRTGFRIVSLGWNEKNPLTGSHVTGGGLTDKGISFVKEAQRVGMLIDVSHISDEGFWDIIKITDGPVIATHSNSRTVCNHSRNLTDDMFKAIVETGGVAGFNQCDAFVGENPTLDTVCDHFLHFLDMDPTGKHIALGGDLDGCDKLPDGFDGVQSYPVMAQRMLERGLSEQMLKDIYWNNALGVMKCAVCNHKK